MRSDASRPTVHRGHVLALAAALRYFSIDNQSKGVVMGSITILALRVVLGAGSWARCSSRR